MLEQQVVALGESKSKGARAIVGDQAYANSSSTGTAGGCKGTNNGMHGVNGR